MTPSDLDRFTRGSMADRQCRLPPPLQGLHRGRLNFGSLLSEPT